VRREAVRRTAGAAANKGADTSVGGGCAVFFFFGCSLLRSMLAREREHKTCATVPGPRHRSNTTLSSSRLLASRPPAWATIKGPSSAWSIWRKEEGGRGRGGSQLPLYLSMLFLRPACAAILRVFVRGVSMFLSSCVSVAFSFSLQVRGHPWQVKKSGRTRRCSLLILR
jgi:hypothetical protein